MTVARRPPGTTPSAAVPPAPAAASLLEPPLTTPSASREVPSTEPQREVWLADRLGREASLAYNESVSLHLRGELDVAALRQAVRELPRRHDALRSTFAADGMTLLVPAQAPELEVPLRDLSALPPAARDAELAAMAERHVTVPFDLVSGPLLRAELVRLDAAHHVLLLTGHHIVLDGWWYWVLVKDLAAIYGLAIGSRAAPLHPAPSFADYAAGCAARADSPDVHANHRWWIERFADGVPTLDLPTDRARAPLRTTRAGREDLLLSAELVAQVKKLGAGLGASLFATLLAGFEALLHRLTGQNDLVVGIPAAGQNAAGLDGLVGHRVNMLPLRARLERGQPFAGLVKETQGVMLDAYHHQDVTFGRVLQVLPGVRDPGRLPLISVIFNIDEALVGESHAPPGLGLELTTNPRHFETFELFINAVDAGAAGMRLECQYNADLFEPTTVRRWLASFETLLRGAVTDPSLPLGRLPVLTADDRRALATWNQTEASYPRDVRIETLVQATARRAPGRVAVRVGDVALTYGQLVGRAAALTDALRAAGVAPGDRVGLMVERDLHLLPALLGTLGAGAAYLPLDPGFPPDRLAFMVKDSAVAVIVTTSALADRNAKVVGKARTISIDHLPAAAGPGEPPAGTAEDAAYVIYTSGSTGTPKGVRVPHRAVVNFLTSMARTPGLAPGDRLAAVTTLSFDIAVLELLLPLVVGAEVVLVPRELAIDGVALRALLEQSQATVMQATPATWRLLLTAGWTGGAHFRALCGGEPLDRELAASLLGRVGELWNLYGPTETTVWSTVHRVEATERAVPIGRPIANTSVHVLDDYLQPVPVGVVGELYIGGDGVTLGYLDRPQLTAERFVPDRFQVDPAARLYRTGDLGRWRDGVLECLGRTDFQVKVRGYRIELGEIEVALARHPAITQAVVVVREERAGDVRLVAYVVAGAGVPSDDALREHLGRTLPEYMVPQRFVALPALPLTPNGKVDRKALPAPTGPAVAGDGPAVAPRTPTEEAVARAFRDTLALPRLSVHDDFFALGGHSLLAAQMTARLARDLERAIPMRAAFEHATVAKLAAWIDGQRPGHTAAPPRIPRRTDPTPAPLSLMQQRVWYMEQLQPGRTVFNVPSAHRLRGALDLDALERAFDQIVKRQAALRTVVGSFGDAPVQLVLDAVDTSLPLEDLSHLPAEGRQATLARRLADEIARPFELSRPPLFRVRLFRLSADEHVLFFMAHHIIWDGWSFDVFYEEMADLYGAYREGRVPTRPHPPVSYADFAAWHRDWLAGPELARQLEYWRAKLAGGADALDLPTDHTRPPTMTGDGGTEWLSLPATTTDALRAVGLREGATLYMTLLGAWTLLLHQLTRAREVVVGTPVRGRNLPELEQVMGFFVNALPLRLTVDPDHSFLELLRAIRTEVVEAFGAQDVPFEQLVRVLDVRRDESRFPIYQAFFSYQDARQRPPRWGNLAHNNLPLFPPSAAQDVGLWILDGVDGVIGALNYNTDILAPETAVLWKQRFLSLVDAIARNPALPARQLLAVTAAENAQLGAWNDTGRDLPAAPAIDAYLAPSFAQHAERVAVRQGVATVTYAELARHRDRIAATLVARGIGRGDVVALHLDRSPAMLAALLGVSATGATYLPLDPGFPAERLAFMLADSGARLVVTDSDVGRLGFDTARVVRIDHEPAPDGAAGAARMASADDAAYLIYTSGSTGRPKGVLVPHGAVVNFLSSMKRAPGLTQTDRLCAVTTLSFDIAVLELLLPLAVGAEIVLATRDQATDGHALRKLLEDQRVTAMQATPATWRMLLEAGWRGGPKFKALCGGEALPEELADALLGRVGQLWNLYGPTETTVWSTCRRIEAGQGGVSIGRPIDNTQVWVLDEAGAMVPIGVPGEIYIAGAGLALGYHRRPELTAERFVPDPHHPGRQLYRTGDLGRWRTDGQLQHLGRTDFQVKIRGYRIELGEIELALGQHAGIAQAVVVARPGPGGEQSLVAYGVARGAPPAADALRAHLRVSLPDYMIPAWFVFLDALPLTPNGKVDRRALPAPDAKPATATSFSGPRSPAEELVAQVWRELLGIERVGVSDNFLDLGGHSLLIMQAIARIEARTGKRISPRAFIFQTLEQVAHDYDQARSEPPAPSPPPRPASGLRRLWSVLTS